MLSRLGRGADGVGRGILTVRDATAPRLRDLDAALIAAHEARNGMQLVTLYAAAADQVASRARAFYLTQAYVIALETADSRAAPLRSCLIAEGAETDCP